MKVISIPDPSMGTRKKFVVEENESELLNFQPGIEVLPAMYHESVNSGNYYYVKLHEPGEKSWKDGGHECIDENGFMRAFHLDSLIVHPRVFAKKVKTKVKVESTGKRGRPKMDPSLKKTVEAYVKTGGKRGRPAKDPSELKSIVYVKTGGKRGRPKKNN